MPFFFLNSFYKLLGNIFLVQGTSIDYFDLARLMIILNGTFSSQIQKITYSKERTMQKY